MRNCRAWPSKAMHIYRPSLPLHWQNWDITFTNSILQHNAYWSAVPSFMQLTFTATSINHSWGKNFLATAQTTELLRLQKPKRSWNERYFQSHRKHSLHYFKECDCSCDLAHSIDVTVNIIFDWQIRIYTGRSEVSRSCSGSCFPRKKINKSINQNITTFSCSLFFAVDDTRIKQWLPNLTFHASVILQMVSGTNNPVILSTAQRPLG